MQCPRSLNLHCNYKPMSYEFKICTHSDSFLKLFKCHRSVTNTWVVHHYSNTSASARGI